MPDPRDPLWRFGSSVIGYDAATGAAAPFPASVAFDPAQIAALTAEPRQYGFHATLKPPFVLAHGFDAGDLRAPAAPFPARRRRFQHRPQRPTPIAPCR